MFIKIKYLRSSVVEIAAPLCGSQKQTEN